MELGEQLGSGGARHFRVDAKLRRLVKLGWGLGLGFSFWAFGFRV